MFATPMMFAKYQVTKSADSCENCNQDDKYNVNNKVANGGSSSVLSKNDDSAYETGVIISTHLIPSHPSLAIIEQTMESLQHISGLPSTAQIIITVDGLNEDTPENRKSYHLLKSPQNEEKRKAYIEALKQKYSHRSNIKIMVSDKHRHLGENIRNAVDLLRPETKFAYILQQDLPFVKDVNHTAIVKTAHEYPEYIRLIRFNHRQNRILKNSQCWNQTEPVQNVNGIHLHKTFQWSDMNHWVVLKFYREHILSKIDLNDFPEATMMKVASKNCSFYGPHMYGFPGESAYLKHTDGAERYGAKLKTRIANGEVKKEDLTANTIREENIIK